MKSSAAFLFLPALMLAQVSRHQSFNDDWRFFKGDSPGAESPGFDDSQWRKLRLPHDWAIEGPFDVKYGANTGGLPISGTGWYRKRFTVPALPAGGHVAIRFDGAMSNARIWLNGKEVGERPYGYATFSIDVTPNLRTGTEGNVIAVRLTPEDRSSRFYPGAGIYRNVWLDVTGSTYLTEGGAFITTPSVSDESATVSVKLELAHTGDRAAPAEVRVSILDANGKRVANATRDASAAVAELQLTVPKPIRWDLTRPYLYTANIEVLEGKTLTDKLPVSFGIRTIAFTKESGFQLNGRTVKFQGVCQHADLGALGMAVNRRAIERQLQILRGAGVNAIRTSHNPPAPELLDLTDRMGFVVIAEAYDMWKIAKVPNGSAKFFDQWYERDVRDFARLDRNHPSVIMWSIGNEIPEQSRADGWQIAKKLTALFHEQDPTRPTTAAFNNWQPAINNKLADNVDVPGFNYKPNFYEQIMEAHPDWVIYGSESASTVSSRGVYHLPLANYQKHESKQVTSYDVVAPQWAMPPDVEFFYQDKLPKRLAGEFVWSGFDYLGEPTPYGGGRGAVNTDWPSHSSYFGFIDLAGFPKDRYYLYESRWTSAPMVHVLPHWNWLSKEGQEIPVLAYSNADEVELFLNGKSLGRKKRFQEFEIPVGRIVSTSLKFTTKYRFAWSVPYQPGTLKAVAYRDGKVVATDERRTAGTPARIRLIADRAAIQADGEDLSFITVRVEDKDGNLCPEADNQVRFSLAGPLELAAVDNGNAATEESFREPRRKAFNGLALAIVRGERGHKGAGKLTAESDGLASASIAISAH